MKNKKFGIIGLFLIGAVLISGIASAFMGGFGQNEDARLAIDNGDYGAWREARMNDLTEERFNEIVERHNNRPMRLEEFETYEEYEAYVEESERMPRMLEFVTEDNFDQVKAMHEARISGDVEFAQAIAEDLGIECDGLREGFGHGRIGKAGQMRGMRMHQFEYDFE